MENEQRWNYQLNVVEFTVQPALVNMLQGSKNAVHRDPEGGWNSMKLAMSQIPVDEEG